nr:Mov34/MPN/PAD-1 family protein [Granulosicoccus sp.]
MEMLIIHRRASGVVKIGDRIHDVLLSYRQLQPDSTEAGGVLLGRHLRNETDLVIDEVTEPQPDDSRLRFQFHRSLAHHNIALQRWSDANQTCAYLGLWHTHPEDVPTPSQTDLHDWRKALKQHTFHGTNLYFIIAGRTETKVWEGIRNGVVKECETTLYYR